MTNTLTRYEALQLAVIRAGGQEALAAALGVTQPTISNWVNRSKQMPAEYVLKAELLYGVSRFDLRPDIYPRKPEIIGECRPPRFMARDTGTGRVIV